MSKPRGHSNVHANETTPYPTMPEKASIPIEGGANVDTVRPLPSLALSREEWKQIGDKMNWFASPPNTNSGTLWIEFHDRGGRVQVDDLTFEGIHAAKFQCTEMLEELETAQEKLDTEEVSAQ